ncbi:glycosyltransferase family 39 protein [Dactylosporangium sp. NPDC005555]|uniref:ArnT family glycosyltransferase n=1 Tax=Dactylosporangium sp. NPDC005555 TaxID=3154889 RepID=UPI0033B44943
MTAPVAVRPQETSLRPVRRPRWDAAWVWQGVWQGVPLAGILALATYLRFTELARLGFNSDEAVYAGTAAAIAGDTSLSGMFPVFRAHPVLFQTVVGLVYRSGVSDWSARAVAAAVGVLTVGVTYLLARRLYGRRAGLIAALLLAAMPYHVVVTRQVLLDGLMTGFATLLLYCVARYAETVSARWLVAAGAALGGAALTKETALVLLGGLYAFFALTPVVRMRLWHLTGAGAVLGLAVLVPPLTKAFAGAPASSSGYLMWQLVRPANHELLFYFKTVPSAVGFATLAAAVGGLVWLRREGTWRERLLVCWIVVLVVFFTMWPVKGYQYLLPIAPALAVLAGRTLDRLGLRAGRLVLAAALIVVTVSLVVPTWQAVRPSGDGRFLAGTGGLAGGREAGRWVRDNVPADAQLLTIGPSMANVLQFYGKRRAYALSVSPNPNERNPSYVPVPNPDRALRDGQFHYVVWDSYTAGRAKFFADKARALVDRFHGVAVYTGTVDVGTRGGAVAQPVIVIYQVRGR